MKFLWFVISFICSPVAVLSNEFFPKFTSKIVTITPLIGVILTTLLCASPVSETQILLVVIVELWRTKQLISFPQDRSSCGSLEGPRSAASFSGGSLARRSICPWLLDVEDILRGIDFSHHIDWMWDAGRTYIISSGKCRKTVQWFRKWAGSVLVPLLCLQSSALGFLLAQKHFTNPLVAVPSAVSVVCMAVNITSQQNMFLDAT